MLENITMEQLENIAILATIVCVLVLVLATQLKSGVNITFNNGKSNNEYNHLIKHINMLEKTLEKERAENSFRGTRLKALQSNYQDLFEKHNKAAVELLDLKDIKKELMVLKKEADEKFARQNNYKGVIKC